MTHPQTNGRRLWPVDGPVTGVHHLDPEPVPDPVHDPHESAPGPVSTRQVVLTPASAIEPEPMRWLWDDRMPQGMITVGPGREGIGKSLFCAWLAARITLGELPGVHYGQPKSVIYAATEDSWEHTLAGRLIVAGADLDRVYRVEVEQIGGISVPLSLPRDCDTMAVAIRDHDVALLVVDPLISAIDLAINVHQDRDLRSGLEPLARLASDTGCVVFGLAHFNKASGTDVLSRIMGGRAFSAVARAVIAFARDTQADDGSCVISQVKNNLGPTDLPSLRYTVEPVEVETAKGLASWGRLVMQGETDTHVRQLMDETPETGQDRSGLEEAKAWLEEYLTDRGGEAPSAEAKQAAKDAEIKERTLQRARTKLNIIVRSEGTPRTTYWRLP